MQDRPESPPRVDRSLTPRPRPSTSAKQLGRTSRDLSKLGTRFTKIELSDDPQFHSKFKGLENDIEMLRDEQKRLQEESRELEEGIKEMIEGLHRRERRRKDLQQITKELNMAQKYLSMADSRPQAEVVRAMETLNEEIFQLTSIVADTIQVEGKTTTSEKNAKVHREHLARLLKSEFVLEVIVPKQLDDTLAIQIFWQAILVRWCAGVIQRWMLVENEEVNNVLGKMYRGVAVNNDQPIAGRWRAIARHAVQKSFPVKPDEPVHQAINALVALPILCGYIQTREQFDDLCGAFQPRIEQLFERCLDFRKMVGEGFTSVDIEPHGFDPGDQFNPQRADLDYEDEESTERKGIIACTLCLGLSKSSKSKNEEGDIVVRREPILKPKVILQDTLLGIIS